MKPLNEQINPKFVIQARKLARYTQLLHKILPIECRNHVEVANIRDQNLMLITDSPVWTTRLRQLSPQILQFLRDNPLAVDAGKDSAQTPFIHHIQITTRYNAAGSNRTDITQQNCDKKKRVKLQISEKTAEVLSQSADSIEHPQLKAALLKMASHNKQDIAKPGRTDSIPPATKK